MKFQESSRSGIEVHGQDEVSTLIDAFNEMMAQIEESRLKRAD
jgi:hypothetical protein